MFALFTIKKVSSRDICTQTLVNVYQKFDGVVSGFKLWFGEI